MTDPKPRPPSGLLYIYRRPSVRVKVNTRTDQGAIDKLRDAVAWLQAHGAPASLEQEMTIAMEAHVAGLAARFNSGDPFPARAGDLLPGRRAGVHGRVTEHPVLSLTPSKKP